VHEVGRRLPRRVRADVEAELLSLLTDALQDRRAGHGAEDQAAIEALQVAILREFGPPAEMAAQYQPPQRYLIGPHLFDLYGIVVAAVAGSLTLAHLLLLGLVLWGQAESSGGLLSSLLGIAGSYLNAILTAFAAVTLTFAVLERVLPRAALDETEGAGEEPWNPRSLPEIQDPTRIERGRLIVEIGLIGFALVVFNFLPDWVGLGFVGSVNGGPVRWHPAPLLSTAFFSAYLPLLNALWILTVGLNVVLLRQGRWQRATRLVDFLLTVFSALILYRVLAGPALLSAEAIPETSLHELYESILPILSSLLRVGLIVALIANAVEAVRKLIRVFRTTAREQAGLHGQVSG
jgi:hypothetical protein